MRRWDLPSLREAMAARVRRSYRDSIIRKLFLWVKGRTVRPLHFLAVASILVGVILGLHCHAQNYQYVVRVDGREVGLVRDAAEVERFLGDLVEKCAALYGMEVNPRQEITSTLEFRPHEDASPRQVAEALRQQIDLVAGAVMVTVDGKPAVPVAAAEDIATLGALLRRTYVSEDEKVTLVKAELLEKLSGFACVVPLEEVRSPEEAAALLSVEKRSNPVVTASREAIVSRAGRGDWEEGGGVEARLPSVHVKTVEEITIEEQIPRDTTYRDNNDMWSGQSQVLEAGQDGRKEVTYRVTRVNGEETDREAVSELILEAPVDRVVERGTASRFTWPVAGGGMISQYFKGSAHRGIDIAAPAGTSILAAESGVVVRSAWGSSQGNYIILYHGRYWTLYLHHSANLVSAGQRVSRGQVIARMGSTGNSTGPHLHFEVRRCNGSGIWSGWYDHPALDPLGFLR